MGRCGGMALYLMAIVLLVALFASSAKCRPEPALLEDGNKESGSNGNNAMSAAVNSTAAASVNGSISGSGGGDVKLEWCLTRHCVYEGRGSLPCFCCAAMKPNACFEHMHQCRGNCV